MQVLTPACCSRLPFRSSQLGLVTKPAMSQRPSASPNIHIIAEKARREGTVGSCTRFRLLGCQSPPGGLKGCRRQRRQRRGWKTVGGRSASRAPRPCGLFICCCLHRKWGCTGAPLTRSFYYRRARQRLQLSSEHWGSHTNLQTALQPTLMEEAGGAKGAQRGESRRLRRDPGFN